MKGVLKGVIIGVCIIVIGAAILIGTLAYNGWSIDEVNMNYEMKSSVIEDDVTALDIEIDACNVITEYHDGENIIVDYPFNKRVNTQVAVDGGRLIYRFKVKWQYRLFGIIKFPQTVIKLPRGSKYDLKLTMNAGTVQLADGLFGDTEIKMNAGKLSAGRLICSGNVIYKMNAGSAEIAAVQCGRLEVGMNAGGLEFGEAECNELFLNLNAGNAEIERLTCNSADIKQNAGSTELGFTDRREAYNITTKISAGKCSVGDQRGTTDKTINVKISAGSAELKFAD